jgi:hypothetical protein
MIDIPNTTIEGIEFKRKLLVDEAIFRLQAGRLEIPVSIYYYTTTDLLVGVNLFNSKKTNERTGALNFTQGAQPIFVVDNITKVNPLTGDYVPAYTPGAMGEYDYYIYLLNNMNMLVNDGVTSLENQLLPASLLRAIAAGRLDYE